eukprot:1672269-Pleurochrysis_carterae.AAC.1
MSVSATVEPGADLTFCCSKERPSCGARCRSDLLLFKRAPIMHTIRLAFCRCRSDLVLSVPYGTSCAPQGKAQVSASELRRKVTALKTCLHREREQG